MLTVLVRYLEPTLFPQASEAARQETAQESSGININKLKEIMRNEDRIDRKLHAEKTKYVSAIFFYWEVHW